MVSIGFLIFVLELVRRRKIKEEYSWLWIAVGISMFTLVLWEKLLLFFSHLIGAEDPTTTIFLFGFIFMLFLNMDYSVKISDQKEKIKKLAQKIAILSKLK
jgi:hypothetical protein